MSIETVRTSYRNANFFFEKFHKDRGGALFDREGFFADIPTDDRTFNVFCFVDGKANVIYMEMYPGIHVEKPFIGQVASYIEKINGERKCASLRIHSNGVLYCHCEQDIEYVAATDTTILNMEIKCMGLLEVYVNVLDKLAHGILLEPDESDFKKVDIAYTASKLKEMDIEKLMSKEDDDPEEDDEPVECDDEDEDEDEIADREIESLIDRKIQEVLMDEEQDDVRMTIVGEESDSDENETEFDEDFLSTLEDDDDDDDDGIPDFDDID